MLKRLHKKFFRQSEAPEDNLPSHLKVPDKEEDDFVLIGQTLSERLTSQEFTAGPPSYYNLPPRCPRMGEGQSKSEYNSEAQRKSDNSSNHTAAVVDRTRCSHGDSAATVPPVGTVPQRSAPPAPTADAAPIERKMSAVVMQMNPVYRDVPFRLASLLEMRSQCSECDHWCNRLKEQLRTSPKDFQYDFVLEKSVARDSG